MPQSVQPPSRVTASGPSKDPKAYPTDPVGYAQHILGISTLIEDQKVILRSLLEPPYRTLVPSGHDVGKTFVAAVAANWWFDSFDPSVIISTAPTKRDVKQLLWSEIRMQRQRAGLSMPFIGPEAPCMRTSEEHWAMGYTANKGESFQGRHRPRMLFIFDEANGIATINWSGTRSMFDPGLHHAWLAIYNPTNTTSQAYIEANNVDDAGQTRWKIFRLSAANHPNLLAELDGQPKPVPHAIGLSMFEDWLKDWCEVVRSGDEKPTDFAWPPVAWCAARGKQGRWYRPGPIFQGRALGLDPDVGDGVWSPSTWNACQTGPRQPFPLAYLPQIGADCATGKGDDYFALHARWGSVSILHRTSNTMDPVRIFEAIQEMAMTLAQLSNSYRPEGSVRIQPRQIPIKIDDDGVGCSVGAFLQNDGHTVHMIGAGAAPQRRDRYPLKRDELWFVTADRAKAGNLYFLPQGELPGLGLDLATLRRLKQQLLAPAWELTTGTGKRQVEPKKKTKEKIGRSPDDADAANLSYYDIPVVEYGVHETSPEPTGTNEAESNARERRDSRPTGGHLRDRDRGRR